jgi:hypothetical protein
MIRPATTCLAFIFICIAQLATAQTSINKISITNIGESASSSTIDGISFTPDGILKTTESGGTKSIKMVATPVVTKKIQLFLKRLILSLKIFPPCNLNMQ